MKKIEIKSLVLGAVIGVIATVCIAAASSTSRVPIEYKVVAGRLADELEKALNRASAEGWSFVSTAQGSDNYGYAIMNRVKQ